MGWRPRDVYQCSPLEFWTAFLGWRKAQGADEKSDAEPMLRDELAALLAGYDPNK